MKYMSDLREFFSSEIFRKSLIDERFSEIINLNAVLITPDVAKIILDRNHNNRPQDARHLKSLTDMMKAGRWRYNGDTIRVSEGWLVLDGQHRLTACVNSDVGIVTNIVFGLPKEVGSTIDQGKKRTNGDVLAFEGYSNSRDLAGLISYYEAVRRGLPDIARINSEEIKTIAHQIGSDLLNSSSYVGRISGNAFKGVLGPLKIIHFISSSTEEECISKEFVNVWKTGKPSHIHNCPAHACREWLIQNSSRKIGKATGREASRAVFYSWDKFRTETGLKTFKPSNCSIPDDDISPRRSALFMARSVLRDLRDGGRPC